MTGNEYQSLDMRDRMPAGENSINLISLNFAKANLSHVIRKGLTLKKQTTERKVMCNGRA